MVVRYCRARLGRITGHYYVADDVAQEVCLAVLAALPRYRDMGRPFASFVFGIASHKVADAVRTASRLAVPFEDLPDGPDERPGPEETVVAYIEAERTRALLAQLPHHLRELLILRVVTGLSAEETGNVLGMSAGAVQGSPAPGTGPAPGACGRGVDCVITGRGPGAPGVTPGLEFTRRRAAAGGTGGQAVDLGEIRRSEEAINVLAARGAAGPDLTHDPALVLLVALIADVDTPGPLAGPGDRPGRVARPRG